MNWMPAATPADWLMKPTSTSKLKLRVDYGMSEPGWDERDAWMRGMVVVKEGQVRDLGSMLVLGLVIWDRPLCPLPIKEEQNYPSPCHSAAPWHGNGGKEKKVFLWSIHPPYRSWSPHPSDMPRPCCCIPVAALLGALGAPGCCCMSDRAGRQTKIDLKPLLLTQEEKRLKQMDNRMANSAGTITGDSSCNRDSLGASSGVVMLTLFLVMISVN